MRFEDITYESADGIATITINRPGSRNALRPKTYDELTLAFTNAANDATIGVVVLTGAGDKAFCAGGDVKDQSSRTQNLARIQIRRVHGLSSVMRMMDKPVIAKVRGFCVGGGNELNIFCDLSISSETGKFGQVGPRVGSVPVWGACQLLARLVGERKAREMIYTCRIYSADEALEMGLINQVVPDDQLDQVVAQVCDEILPRLLLMSDLTRSSTVPSPRMANYCLPSSETRNTLRGSKPLLKNAHLIIESIAGPESAF